MIFYEIKRSVPHIGSVHMQIENKYKKVGVLPIRIVMSNISGVGSLSELLSVSAAHQPLYLINLIFLVILIG